MTRVLILALLILSPLAEAQILPGAPLPPLPGGLSGALPGNLGTGAGLAALTRRPARELTAEAKRVENARKLRIRNLLRRHADVLEADPDGDPIVRGQVLAFSPTDAALARALAAGFSVLRDRALVPLGMRIVSLAVPRGTSTPRALRLLRRLDPRGTYAFNNIYMQSGGRGAGVPPDRQRAAHVGEGAGGDGLLGLIDGGVGTSQPVFRGSVIHRHGCGGRVVPSTHGTEVASLMVGRSRQFGGAAPGATLYAADVYCGKPTGGSVEAVAEAFAWLVGRRVAVINISLVGPPNALLRRVVERVVARGSLIVAAVGNDGPAAPPLYPAAYPGVVGVTAVDARRRVIFEAERGPQVTFAAPGADIMAATVPAGFAEVRGTSFAAPLVAGLLAARLGSPNPVAARRALAALAHEAIHLGAPGRNPVFGYGLVGANLPAPEPAPGLE
ncbi:MAG TPA: S8 family serine peptidase [Steroidobacteraceae bacterium]|nr:S8 family serine peptidase [Steroidobacteraceae bacterium]